MPEVVRTVGRYGILREIGRGGMGLVYLARQLDLDRLVALKEMAAFHAADPDLARRFVRESRLAGSLIHANVVTVFDYFEHEGVPYIAMEYVERGSLRPYVGQLTLAQIGGVVEGLLAGLAAAEQRGIVHRDLKPENLMVTTDGGVKIADFGIAKATQVSRTSAFVTATGTTIGTPAYMAPEQAMAKDIGPWTDLYSLGCIAFELFTGLPPFSDADTPMAIMLRQISEPLPAACEMADVDQDISDWIARMTAKAIGDRPGSATEAWEALEEILIAKLGPRWRRDARLPEPSSLQAREPSPSIGLQSSEFRSFEWDNETGEPPEELEGIDLEGTGPDTPLPTAVTADAATADTFVQRRSEPHTPATTTRLAVTSPQQAIALARGGGIALLTALLIPAITSGDTRWNLFAVLSPLEAAGTAIATLLVASRLKDERISIPSAAGCFVGFGVLSSVASLGLLKFALEWLGTAAVVLTIIAGAASVAILVAGIMCTRASPSTVTVGPAGSGALVLGLVGTVLAGAALFVNYDGFSSLWSELGEGGMAEFFFEPAVAVAAMLAGVVMLEARARFASGLLIAVGTAMTLHFVGLLIAAWRAIGEPGEVRAAGFIGVLGSLIVIAAGAYATRPRSGSHASS